MEHIFHTVGFCPDSATHWDLMDAFFVNGQEVWMAFNVCRLYVSLTFLKIRKFLSNILPV